MSVPLKDQFFNPAVVDDLARRLAKVHPPFDRARFVAEVVPALPALELTQRAERICDALEAQLPAEFPAAVRILVGSLGAGSMGGFLLLPFSIYVSRHGQADFELSMHALVEITKRFTSEFAIRHFIRRDPERTLARMREWARHPDPRVRRLASEGCRPRLPWAMRLHELVADPAPVVEILELLKDDADESVRRSVANNLNDIAKDHPDVVVAIAARWLDGASRERAWIVRHGLRSLVKKGHGGALALLGSDASDALRIEALEVHTPLVRFGDELVFSFRVRSAADASLKAVLTYAVHHRKARGTTAPTRFRLSVREVAPGLSDTITRRHAIRPITTRRYYPGAHALEVFVNGVSSGVVPFELRMD